MGPIFCYLKGCTKCGGDLIFDAGDWRCWQCGQYYYPVRPGSFEEVPPPTSKESVNSQPDHIPLHGPEQVASGEPRRRGRRRAYGARAARNIDAVVKAKQLSDERWWARNSEIITHLDLGLTVREVARLFARGERQIRVIKERLADMRAAAADDPQSA